ncbi:ATP-binding SpoIIE family protein phosphatase [Methylomonas albis]|uniref:SpoIIE family protein phosphatase n=1 Tax=Methylomonas albis TaxID=1854563 RepID=A0ABR9D357_9GAMM|nr:ATP-binding SpoIIE family protein phosphatase [Methylomonas albis]MBD9357231.1 SpoIIE family protein phosphatase [Methylomonas albis]
MNQSNPFSKPAQTSIVLLEDDGTNSNADSLQGELLAQDFRCAAAASADDVIARLTTASVDLLIIACREWPWQRVVEMREAADSYLPIILIADDLTDTLLDHCAAVEIDAVICRPVNHRLLLLKIRSSLKLGELYQREREQKNQLLDYWQTSDLEHEVAAKLFNNVLKAGFLETEAVKVVMSPLALFNGDLVLVAKTPENHLHVLLGDFTGHGLSASIAATPLADIFYGMTRKGFDINEIVTEINAKLYQMLPVNRSLAASVIALYPESSSLKSITCGLPEHFLVNHADNSFLAIRSLNIPLGIQATIDIEEQLHRVSENDSLYLLTDGIFEAENAQGELFGGERILSAIRQSKRDDIKNLQASLEVHTGGTVQKDDNSLVILSCAVDSVPWGRREVRQPMHSIAATTWKQMMEFDIDSLRLINPVPVMVNTLMEIQGLQNYRQDIFMIVSELFANALDHGLLGLDSSLKSSPEGFMRFYARKDQCLQQLKQGRIRLLFIHQPTEQGGRLIVKMRDSGMGFDWHARTSALDSNQAYCGRGISLLETLCSSLVYHGCGNRVTAVFDWQR